MDTRTWKEEKEDAQKQGCTISGRLNAQRGQAMAQLVEALPYKPEDRGFDSRWCVL
jgi:hypothetical protein